jgi:hypothetical protein
VATVPAVDDAPAAPADDAPASEDPGSQPADADDPFEVPAADEPAAEEPGQVEPAARRSREPNRRWVNSSGTYAIVAALIDIRADGACVLETAGHRFVVPVAKLSPRDVEYVVAAGPRIAAARAAQPAVRDTAGL